MLERPPAACQEFQEHLTTFDLASLVLRQARYDLAVIRGQRPSVWWPAAGFVLLVTGFALLGAGSGWARSMMWGDVALVVVYIVRELRWQRRETRAERKVNALKAQLQRL